MKKLTNFEQLLLASNLEEQDRILKAIIRSDPTNLIACVKLGNIYCEKGLYSDALRLHKNLLVEHSLSPEMKKEVYISIIKDYIGTGKSKSALPYVRKLHSLDSGKHDILLFIYSFYENFGYWKEAIDLKHKLLHLERKADNRGIAILHAFWGAGLIKGAKKKEGLSQFKKALALDSLCLPALLFMGDFYYEDGEIKKGIDQWKQILDNFPDYAFLAFERLEKAYFEKHVFSSLEPLYTSFLDQHPEDVRVIAMLSEIYAKKGENKEAIELLERAKNIDPDNLKIREKLLRLYHNNKQYEEMFKEGEKLASKGDYKGFKCYKCGKELFAFEFKCPHCKSWLTIR